MNINIADGMGGGGVGLFRENDMLKHSWNARQ